MNFKTLRQRMPGLLASGISIEIQSAPGRGKSEFVFDTIDIMQQQTGVEWGFSTMFLATQTPPDLIGYIFKGERAYGDKTVAISEPTLPGWMMTAAGRPVWEYKRGILFLDEYGQGEADVKRASAELLLNRRLGPWQLPDGWSVIAASNRASDRSGVTKSFDFVINRRIEVPITDDIESWNSWATEPGKDGRPKVLPLTLAFANQNPQIVFADGVPEKQGPWCTPRSLVMNDKMLRAQGNGDDETIPDGPDMVELSSGIIGSGAAAQYFAFVRLEREMPKFQTIVNDPMKVKVPEKPDAQMLVCYNLAHRITKETAAPVIKYVERMPKEFSVTFAKAACQRDKSLVNTPAFSKWAMENASLMAAIAK